MIDDPMEIDKLNYEEQCTKVKWMTRSKRSEILTTENYSTQKMGIKIKKYVTLPRN